MQARSCAGARLCGGVAVSRQERGRANADERAHAASLEAADLVVEAGLADASEPAILSALRPMQPGVVGVRVGHWWLLLLLLLFVSSP